jgi:hypothetical protein
MSQREPVNTSRGGYLQLRAAMRPVPVPWRANVVPREDKENTQFWQDRQFPSQKERKT